MMNITKEQTLKQFKIYFFLLIGIFSLFTFAVPLDISGELGYDSIRLSNFRRTDASGTVPVGSNAIAGDGESSAYLQSYLLKLKPNMVVNDHVTVKGEVSTGKGRGGKIGEGDYNNSAQGMGQAHYYHTIPQTSGSNNNLNVNQLYMDIYSETATYRVGRYAKNWGLGALINSGEKSWDRFFTYYEGAEAVFSLGKLYITPSWSNISNNETLTHNGEIKDISISLLYDNPDKDMKFGVYLGKRKTNGNAIYTANGDENTAASRITFSDSNLLDLFMSRYWGKFFLGVEVPYLYGTLGNLNGTATDFKGLGVITQTSYEFNERWKGLVDFGLIDGEKGQAGSFTAVYLHPNYQIAEIMFRYNLDAVNDSDENVYESSITNATFLKLGASYQRNLWTWNMSWIYAKANEVAKSGSRAYQHEQGYHFTSNADQKDDLGHEFDLTFDYKWNPNLTLSGVMAYYMVGDYYAFSNNSANENATSNQMAAGLKLNLQF